MLELIGNNTVINQWHEQVITTVFFLQKAKRYLDEVGKTIAGNPMEEGIKKGEALLQNKTLACVLNFQGKNLSLTEMFKFDKLLRCDMNKQFA